jgi:hypothetical protein
MNKPFIISSSILLFAIGVGVPSIAWGQDAADKDNDPQRWYKELITSQDRYANAKKEALAAYQQALAECRAKQQKAGASCKQEARKNFEADMTYAKNATNERNPGTGQ